MPIHVCWDETLRSNNKSDRWLVSSLNEFSVSEESPLVGEDLALVSAELQEALLEHLSAGHELDHLLDFDGQLEFEALEGFVIRASAGTRGVADAELGLSVGDRLVSETGKLEDGT